MISADQVPIRKWSASGQATTHGSVYVLHRDAGSREFTDLERQPGIRWLQWRIARLRRSPMAPHPVRFVPGIRWWWGKFPIIDRTPPPDPKYPYRSSHTTAPTGRLVIPPRGARSAAIATDVTRGCALSAKRLLRGSDLTTGNPRPWALIRFCDRRLRLEAKAGLGHFEGLPQIEPVLPTGRSNARTRSSQHGSRRAGLGHRGSEDTLTGGNKCSKHGRIGLDSGFSWDGQLIKD